MCLHNYFLGRVFRAFIRFSKNHPWRFGGLKSGVRKRHPNKWYVKNETSDPDDSCVASHPPCGGKEKPEERELTDLRESNTWKTVLVGVGRPQSHRDRMGT